jgi:hypothetical protein
MCNLQAHVVCIDTLSDTQQVVFQVLTVYFEHLHDAPVLTILKVLRNHIFRLLGSVIHVFLGFPLHPRDLLQRRQRRKASYLPQLGPGCVHFTNLSCCAKGESRILMHAGWYLMGRDKGG